MTDDTVSNAKRERLAVSAVVAALTLTLWSPTALAAPEQFGKDPSSWGEWIADVERPAEQFRSRYQLQ
jgi:hypothetical protein